MNQFSIQKSFLQITMFTGKTGTCMVVRGVFILVIAPGLSDHDAAIVSFVGKLYLQNQLPRKVFMYIQETKLGYCQTVNSKPVRRIF